MLQSNAEWERLAKADPLFHIASVKGMERGNWERGAFFAKGETYVGYVERFFSGTGPALDIGCGAGRISRALAKRFVHVTGVDVSPTMIELAREMCADVTNADFVVGNGVGLPASDQSISTVVSFQVLQHIDRTAINMLLRECHRIKMSDGVVILHIPAPSTRSSIQRWLRLIPPRRALTLLAQAIGLQTNGRFWIKNQYHTYGPETVIRQLKSAGFTKVETMRWRVADPLSTVYIAH